MYLFYWMINFINQNSIKFIDTGLKMESAGRGIPKCGMWTIPPWLSGSWGCMDTTFRLVISVFNNPTLTIHGNFIWLYNSLTVKFSSDAFRHFESGREFFCFAGQSNQAITGIYNLNRASQVSFPGEKILEDAKTFSYRFLREKQASKQLLDKWIITKDLPGEVSCRVSPYNTMFEWISTLAG